MTRLRATLRPLRALALRLPDTVTPLAVEAVPALEARLLPLLRGPAGPAGAVFTHTQSSAAAEWTINHNLGFRPAVSILDSGGLAVEGDVLHTSANQTVITFAIALAGTARLN